MSDISAYTVQGRAEVAGTEFNLKSIETRQRNHTVLGRSNYAKIKGNAENPSAITPGALMKIYISVNENEKKIFTGTIKRAEMGRDGIIKIEAYDITSRLANYDVNLDTEEPRKSSNVAEDLLKDVGLSVSRSGVPQETFSAYIAPSSEFPGGDPRENHAYGAGRGGQSVIKILQKLTSKLHGIIWVDRNNVLRIEPWPYYTVWKAENITNLSAGESQPDVSQVIAKGGSSVGENGYGLGAQHIYSRVSKTSKTKWKENLTATKVLEDKNVTTQKGTDKMSSSEHFKEHMQISSGKIEVIGHPGISIFDLMKVPEFKEYGEYKPKPISVGKTYTINSIKHIFNPQDGYITRVTLFEDPKEIGSKISGSNAIAKEATDKIESNKKDESPLNYEHGFE